MMRAVALTLSLFLLGCAAGVFVYWLRHPSPEAPGIPLGTPSALARQYRYLLKRDLLSYTSLWHEDRSTEEAYVRSGGASPEEVRLDSSLALGYSVLAVTGTAPAANREFARKARWLLRRLIHIHRTGPSMGADGKKWGGSADAAFDASNLGLVAYLIRSTLTPADRNATTDVVRFEAERYLLTSPATGAAGNSAAIANAAASSVLVTAGTIAPTGGVRAAYQRRAATFLSSVFTTFYDSSRGGPPPTLFPDLTLQYGGGFSVSAELQVIATLGHCSLCYRLSQVPQPAALDEHVTDCWRRVLTRLALPQGWLLGAGGGTSRAGEAVTWLATAFHDEAAGALDREAALRLTRYPLLEGDQAHTPLQEPRAVELAYRVLFFRYFENPTTVTRPLQSGVTATEPPGVSWLPSASLAVNRETQAITGFSWNSGAGQEWLPVSGNHVRWVFTPTASVAIGSSGQTPAWTINPTDFSTNGMVRLDDGATLQAAVFSLARGASVLLERYTPAATENASTVGTSVPFSAGNVQTRSVAGQGSSSATRPAGSATSSQGSSTGREAVAIELDQPVATEEPDLFRDDEHHTPVRGLPRWANVNDDIALVALDGDVTFLALPGISPQDRPKVSWPLLKVRPGADRLAMLLIYPEKTARLARQIAEQSHLLRFADPGWAGALFPSFPSGETLISNRFFGATSTTVSLSSPEGAPVLLEDGNISGGVSTATLSSPAESGRSEHVSCWLSVDRRGTIDAHQTADGAGAAVTNSGESIAHIVAHYVGTGRSCVLSDESGRVIFRVPGRHTPGEVHFMLGPGRSATLQY